MSEMVPTNAQYLQAHVIDPNDERVRMVEAMMREHLSRDQTHKLRDVLEAVFGSGETATADNEKYIEMFLTAKRVENLTDRTLKYYGETISKCIAYIGKPIRLIDANDIRRCLSWALTERKCSPVTVNNERRCLSTFFQWLEDEDIIRKSPVKRTKSLKEETADKKPFSDEEVVKLREACRDKREKAIFELLLSSGVRVAELCGLNRSDMDFNNQECEVFGKGRKRRTCYFSAAAKLAMQAYLAERDDDEDALFVSLHKVKGKYQRLKVSRIESLVAELGEIAGVENVHPHRFRRTFATNNLKRGMPLEEIQQLMGHSKIDTTLIYAKTDKDMLRMNAKRLS